MITEKPSPPGSQAGSAEKSYNAVQVEVKNNWIEAYPAWNNYGYIGAAASESLKNAFAYDFNGNKLEVPASEIKICFGGDL